MQQHFFNNRDWHLSTDRWLKGPDPGQSLPWRMLCICSFPFLLQESGLMKILYGIDVPNNLAFPLIHPSICPPNCLFIYPLIQSSIYSSTHLSIYPISILSLSIHLSFHLLTHLSIYPYIQFPSPPYLSICHSTYSPIHPFIYLSIHPSIDPSIHQFIYQNIHPSVHPSTYAEISERGSVLWKTNLEEKRDIISRYLSCG